MNTQARLQQAAQHLQRGEVTACMAICNELLQSDAQLLAAFNLRGLALAQARDYPAAIRDLSRVWPAQAQNTQAALWLGRMYRLEGDYPQAIAPLQAAVGERALEVEARYELALVLTRVRQVKQAIAQYRKLLGLQPGHVNVRANLAFLLERANRREEALDLAEQVLQADPENFMAGLTRGTLLRRNGQLESAQLQLERCLQQPLSPMNQSIVLHQLGQCLLARQQYSQAFGCFSEGNELLRSRHPHGVPVHQGSYGLETIARLRDWLKKNPPSGWSRHPPDSVQQAPVFMVGFPRSGTTLMDQVLSAHPQVEVLEEFEFLDQLRKEWIDGDGLQQLPGMNQQQWHRARQQYLDELAVRRKSPQKPCVVDKLPLNLVYLLLVHRLFPEARILFMLRDPRDACLSCFFQSFDLQGAMPYFLDLQQTAVYYDAVMSLARQSMAVISNPLKLQRYEDLVTDFEPSVKAVLQFLDLPWSEEILQYRQRSTGKVIDTPSYQQVTQPLYTEAMGRWRHFSSHLEPLQPWLGPWVEYFEY